MITRAVLFDLDGTLYTMRALKIRLTVELWRDLGILRQLGPCRRQLRGQSFASGERYYEALFGELGRRSRRGEQAAGRWYRDRFIPCFIRQLSRHAVPRLGLSALLGRLRGQGTGLAVISDYGWVAERLRALGISPELFDLLLSTEELGALKPSPAAIQLVRQRWGLKREDVLLVGDRQDRDGESAKAAGVEYLQVRTGLTTWTGRQGHMSWQRARQAMERFSSGNAAPRAASSSGDEEWVEST